MANESAETQVDQRDNTAVEGERSDKPGLLKKAGKGLWFTATRASGADVIYKDAKRVKPRHPQLWKDLWNARAILKERKEAEEKEGRAGVPLWRARRNAFITMLAGLAIALYGIVLISSQSGLVDLRLISKISMVALMSVGFLQAFIYGWIFLKLTQRQMSGAHPNLKDPHQSRPHNDSRKHTPNAPKPRRTAR